MCTQIYFLLFQQLLQQHINRGLKRHARMTGRDAPDALELRANIHKRMYIPSTGPGARKPKSKRYNRKGVFDVIDPTETAKFLSNKFAGKGHGQKAGKG